MAGSVLRFAAAAAVAAVAVVVWSSSAWAAAPEFLTADAAPEAAAVTLLAVGDNQVRVGPPVRARDTDAGDSLTYRMSDTDAGSGHSDLFSIDSGSGQISRWADTPAGVYQVTVSVSDDGFDADDADTASVDVVIHVTSAGLYPRWSQARSVTASDGSANDWFGVSVAVNDEVMVVGAPWGDSSTVTGSTDGAGSGAAYVFDADTGEQLARLDSPVAAGGGWFGWKVELVGGAIFVSAPKETVSSVAGAGAVYVFKKPDGGWADDNSPDATLTPGPTSAPRADGTNKLLAGTGLGAVNFGMGLAVSDDGATLVAGAPYWENVPALPQGKTRTDDDLVHLYWAGGASDNGMDRDGAMFVFAKPDGGWASANTDATTGVARLYAGSREWRFAQLGSNIAISNNGDTIAAAAFGAEQAEGWVYMFTRPSGGWADTAAADTPPRLSVTGRHRNQRLGSKGIDISGDGSTVVAGAPVAWRKGAGDDSQIPADATGAAYVFARPAGGWADATQTAKLASFGHKYDAFGGGVAISDSGNKIAVTNSDSRSSNFRGSAYVYDKPDGGWADDLDGAGDNVRVLTAPTTGDNAADGRQRYGFGGRGLAFDGENSLIVGQISQIWALHKKDGLSSLPAGGLYGANADHSDRSNVAQGSAHVFDLADAPPAFTDTDRPLASASVKLLAVGDNQTLAGPPVRADYYGDPDDLTYTLSDDGNGHSGFFTIDAATGQISRRSSAPAVMYRVKVSVTDGTGSDTTDVVIHVTSAGRYPGEDAWVQQRSFKADDEDKGNQFGRAVAYGDVVVVGAVQAPSPGHADEGAAYVFDPDSGAQLAKLNSIDTLSYGWYGEDVATVGDTVVVGAPNENYYLKGRVYVYVKPPTGWAGTPSATAVLTPGGSDDQWSVNFGNGVALSDDGQTLVVGAPGRGAAFVFTKPPGGWADANSTTAVRLTAGDRAEAGDDFGERVAISGDGNTIAVTAPETGTDNVGVVYVFTKTGGSWTATTAQTNVPRLSLDDTFPRQTKGHEGVALSDDGSTLVTSAEMDYKTSVGDDDARIPATAHGSAFVYVRPARGWADATETAELRSFGHKYDHFGYGVDVSGSGDRVAVGNPWSRSSNYRGSVYVYDKPAGGWADDLDGAGDNLRVLTLADADTDPRHRYSFGSRVAFRGEDHLAVGQDVIVWPLNYRDGLTRLPAGGLYGANLDHTGTIPSGSAHLFELITAPPRPTTPAAPPPPPPPPDDGTDGPDGGPDGPDGGTDEPGGTDGPDGGTDGTDGPDGGTDGPPEFTDVDEDSVHAESIKKVAALGITTGTTPTTFSPDQDVSRAQLATFAARAWKSAGRTCPADASSSFDDVAADSTHASGIDCMSALGVARGTADRMFSPSAPVSRAQMATFLARAWTAAGRECPADAGSSFDDVPADSTHAAGIACMAAQGITRGTAAGTFSPSDTVTRAQMAAFLARFHEALTDTA